jgi:hypothetical protein
MAELSVAHRAMMDPLIAACSDAMLIKLADAVGAMTGDRAQLIASTLAAAVTDRARRDIALRPLMPLFAPRPDGLDGVNFPQQVLSRLWTQATAGEPDLLSQLDEDGVDAVAVADRLCRAGAAAVRDAPETVWPEALAPDKREDGLSTLAACLDLAPLARRALSLLPTWVGRPDGDQLADLRLLVTDSAGVAPDGACRMMEILFAHLGDAALILRIVTHSSNAASRESFLGVSEMAIFVDRLIAGIQARVRRVEAYQPTADATATERLLQDIAWSAAAMGEIDVTLKPQPDGPWGKALRDARVKVATRMTALMMSADKLMDTALPLTRTPLAGRMTRASPRLDVDPEAPTMHSLATILTLVGRLRGSAAVFGCESDRRKLSAQLVERLSTYADEALDLVNAGEAPDENRALALIECVADLLGRLDATDAARTVRRRAAVAGAPTTMDGPSPQAA